jgi:hypothetical protein
MHLVSVAPKVASSRHQAARLRNSSRQAKDHNLTLNLQIVEAEKQPSTAPSTTKVLEAQLLVSSNWKRGSAHGAMGLESLSWSVRFRLSPDLAATCVAGKCGRKVERH